MLKIDGERVYLRDHKASDLDVFHAWLSDAVVAKYLSWRTYTREESFTHLAHSINENNANPRTDYFFALVLNENEHIIGEAGFTIQTQTKPGGIAELGYFLLQSYWGKGYATEAAKLLIAYCFTVLKLHKVTAGCDVENRASEKVMINCGMQQEAYRKKQRLLNGEWRDRLEYALLYDDWKA
ncbi:MAG: GNAT family N-acetyltransferase [Anaerolineaceae bacterium]|nr:GNAT family N-acetyltransferase [Anaerolineaceae bacterium]